MSRPDVAERPNRAGIRAGLRRPADRVGAPPGPTQCAFGRRTPVRVAATLVEHLRLLGDEPGRGDRLAAGLSRLGRDVAAAVPSCLTVSIVLAHPDAEISISATAGTAKPGAVLASLAVPLPGAVPAGVMVLRASAVGAFLLLADDLGLLLGAGHPPIGVDEHLTWPPAASFPTSLADLHAVDQAVGVLIDRGLPPETARRELQQRADAADTTVAAVSRALLADLPAARGRG
jgi:hypothetical protein